MKKQCVMCGKDHERRSKYCSKECGLKALSSEENREKISISRKKFLAENPEKHPWRNPNKKKSVPCEKVKEYLIKKNIKFIEEWIPLEDRFFSIDIAFPDIKLGVEINGNQHYERDGSLKPYYQDRHDLIEAAGWKLIELHYSYCFNEELLDKIFILKDQPDYTQYFEDKRIREEKNKPKYGSRQKFQEANSIKYKEKWEPFVEKILNSDIDFSKYGWVEKVSKILDIKTQKVNGWMKKFLPDFYNDKCFKRKPPAPTTVF
jgi:very-short-patch-repair endonuclease